MTTDPRLARTFSRRTAVGTSLASIAAIQAMPGLAHAQDTATSAPIADEDITPDSVARAIDALADIVADAMERSGVPGRSVAVVHGGETVAARGYGVANTETDGSVDADTIFQIASLSKPVASTVVGDGLVDWDTHVADHLPGFALHDPWVTGEVTIRDMFCHRSGLPEHAGDLLKDIGYDRDEILHRLRYQPLETSFRSAYNYTNFGLTAAAVSASNAAGQSWEDASEERLYGPAGMTRTSSRFDDYVAADNCAYGHVRVGDTWSPEYVRQPDAQSPAGGVSSTAIDMARWMLLQLGNGMLEGEEIIDGTALAENHRPQMITDTPIVDPAVDHARLYGLGWNVGYGPDGSVTLSHSGAFALGTGTTVYLLPAEGLGIVVLTNGEPVGVAESVALGFLDVVRAGTVQNDYVSILGEVFARMMVPQYGTDVDYDSPPTKALPPQQTDAYAGTYGNLYFGDVTVAQQGDIITLSLGPRPDTYDLTHWNRDTFIYLPIGENQNHRSAVTFRIGPDGTASQVWIENLDLHGIGAFVRRIEE